MRNISESVGIEASRDQLWGLLVDPDAIAQLCPGVSGAELLDGEPMHEGSEMAVKLVAASELVMASVVEFDPTGYAMRSEITSGPHSLRGSLGSRLEIADGTSSQLFIDGSLGCDWLGKPALAGFLLAFKFGLPLLSQSIADLARAKSPAISPDPDTRGRRR